MDDAPPDVHCRRHIAATTRRGVPRREMGRRYVERKKRRRRREGGNRKAFGHQTASRLPQRELVDDATEKEGDGATSLSLGAACWAPRNDAPLRWGAVSALTEACLWERIIVRRCVWSFASKRRLVHVDRQTEDEMGLTRSSIFFLKSSSFSTSNLLKSGAMRLG